MGLFSSRTARTRSGRIFEQLGTIGFSILLALIVWLIAINQEDPIVQGEFSERIPVTVRGLAEGLQPLQDLSDESVRVTIRAPQSSWDDLVASDFTAYIDLSGLAADVHDVAVNVEVRDPRVDIQSVTRPQLRVQLDDVEEKEVPVRVDVMDSSAFGYDWQPPVVMPMTVTVSGPSTQVDQVTVAGAEVYLRNAKNQVERTEPLTPLNPQGQSVPRVAVSPPNVRVVVPVEEWPGRKEVAVRVSLEGQPPAGYRLSSVRVNPSTVVLLGNADVLSDVPGFVETEPIQLTDATSEIQQRLSLIVPDDVTVLEGDAVDVTASIAAIEGGTTVRQEPVIQGLAPGLEAGVALDTVEVILSGPLPLLESLGADDVFVILDLTGLLPGVHTVAPRVVAPDQIRSEGVIPQQVEVVITDRSAVDVPPVTAAPPTRRRRQRPRRRLPRRGAQPGTDTPSPEATRRPAGNGHCHRAYAHRSGHTDAAGDRCRRQPPERARRRPLSVVTGTPAP